MRHLPLVLAAALSLSPARATELEITSHDDRELVIAITDATGEQVAGIASCQAGGRPLAECQCPSRAATVRIEAAIQAALAAHPEWQDQILILPALDGGPSLTLFLADTAQLMAKCASPGH